MITSKPNEMDRYQDALGREKQQGTAFNSIEESVLAFRKYQQELTKLRSHCQPALEECDRGEYADFNLDDVKARVRKNARHKRNSE